MSPHVGEEYRSHMLAHIGQNLFSMGVYLAATLVGGWNTIESGDNEEMAEIPIESGDKDEMAEITLKVSVLMMAASLSEVFLGSVRALVLSEDQKVSVSQHYIKTRLGMFVMIVLGESIIQLVANKDVSSAYHLGVCVCYVTIVFCMASIYFDNQPVLASQHAMKNGTMNGLLYIYTHPFLAYCILTFGVAIKRIPIVEDLSHEQFSLLSSSFGMSLVFINVIRATHAHVEITGSLCRCRCLCLCFFVCVSLSFLSHSLSLSLSLSCVCLFCVWTLVLSSASSIFLSATMLQDRIKQ